MLISLLFSQGVPANTPVSIDARSALGKSASIFVLYLTSQAKTLAQDENRKTISPQDILDAAKVLGFNEFSGELEKAFKESKKLNDEVRRKRAEKQRMKSKANPASLLNHDRGDHSNGSIGEQESQGAEDTADVIEIDDE